MNLEELKVMFNEVQSKTNNFTKIEPSLLLQNPKILTLFRILLGIKQNDAKKTITPSIADYETGRYKKMKLSKAEKIAKKIKYLVKNVNPSLKLLEQNYENLNGLREKILKQGLNAFGDRKKEIVNNIRKGVINFLELGGYDRKPRKLNRPKTQQEIKIAKILENRITFEQDCDIKGINTDFAIPSSENPEKIIMATEIQTQRYEGKFQLIERIALRGFRLRKRIPNSKLICFVSVSYLTPAQRKLLEEAYDHVLINDFEKLNLIT